MLDKLRWKSKPDAGVARKSVAEETRPTTSKQTNFFSLPAELRNVIYEDVARETLIRIPSAKERAAKQVPPIPSLLVVSQLTRNEYLPLLLEFARIRVVVKDYDFRRLARVCSSLYSTELKALRNNPYLKIELLAEKCTKDSLVALRRWLENRGRGLDRLPWGYGITWKPHQQILPTSTPVCMANAYIMRRKVLHHNLEVLTQLHGSVGEVVAFELLSVIDAFQAELASMRGQSSKNAACVGA